MIAVIFEIEPAEDARKTYFDITAELRPLLDEIDGFLSIERFQSLTDEKRLLSLSFWRDEAAIAQWRQQEMHLLAQTKGRAELFQNYRLRVGDVRRDYDMHDRAAAPKSQSSKGKRKTNS